MPANTSEAQRVQPLTNRRKMMRGIFGLVAIAIILIGIIIVQSVRDVDFPPHVDTVGWIAAIKAQPNGSQVVLFKPDGTIVESQGYQDGVNDRDPVWRPDGNRLFFTSDREPPGARQVNLYRWNPGSNKVERRTATQGSYTNLLYSDADATKLGLVALGGQIVEFDPVTGDTAPVLPEPRTKSAGGDGGEEGRKGSIENSLFAPYGNSFRSAAWFDDDKYIVTIMTGDEGESLLLQNMTPVQGQLPAPVRVAFGDHIDMSVNRKNGTIAFTLQGFKFPDPNHIPPENLKNGKVVPPFRHMVAMLDPKKPSQSNGQVLFLPVLVSVSLNDKNAFGMPVFAPDGNGIVVAVGTYNGGEFNMTGLLGMPAVEGGGRSPSPIHRGAVTGVTFSGDNKQIAYTQHEPDGSQTLHVMDYDGKNDHVLGTGQGSFSQPAFSPQVAGG